jgi:hypothetical protein
MFDVAYQSKLITKTNLLITKQILLPQNNYRFSSSNNNNTPTTTTTITMDEETQWRADAVPHFAEPALRVAHMKESIDVGSFLVVEAPVVDDGVEHVICRFVKSNLTGPTTTLVCNIFKVSRATGTGANLLSRHMDSVEQTHELMEVDPSRVIDLVFVFLQKDIDDLKYVAQGRRDSFVLLTHTPGNNGFLPFPCQYGNFNLAISLCRRVWRDMDTIRRCFRKILCSERMHQSTFAKRRDKVSCSDEAWAYLLRRVDDVVGVTYSTHDSFAFRADYEIGPAMRAVAKRRKLNCSAISFNGNDGIKAFNALFGESSTLGIREKRPLLDKPERRLGVNDVLSYCSFINLKFCEGTVHVHVHYNAYSYDTDPLSQSGLPLFCPDDQLLRFLTRRSSAVIPLVSFQGELLDEELDEGGSNNNNNNNNQQTFDAREARELLCNGARLRYNNRTYRVKQSLGEEEHSMVEISLIGDAHGIHQPELIRRHMAVQFRKQYIN